MQGMLGMLVHLHTEQAPGPARLGCCRSHAGDQSLSQASGTSWNTYFLCPHALLSHVVPYVCSVVSQGQYQGRGCQCGKAR